MGLTTGLGAGPAGAHTRAGELERRSQVVQWSGSLARGDRAGGEVAECQDVACDRFRLRVDLPHGVWKPRRAGGVEVSLRWQGFGNNLKLYVYRRGSRVAASDGIIATAQSVLIPEAENGRYDVYVAFDPDSATDAIAYDALAEVEYAPKPRPLRRLLPDLEARPQRNITFDTPQDDFFEPSPPPGESCFASERAEEGAETCLRFDQVFANVGEGPLEMRFMLGDPGRQILQRLHWSDGVTQPAERSAGQWEWHEVHQHFHYTGFGVSRLWAVNATGGRLGLEPVRSARKVSFCIVDIEIDSWARKGNGPRTYMAPDCLFENDEGILLQGLTPGWADVYDWFLPDQYIEVSGVVDGTYLLETTADPDDTIEEADETNNCSSVYVQLTGMATATPHARQLRSGPSC